MKTNAYKSLDLLVTIAFLLNFGFFGSSVNAQSYCTTPDYRSGYCLPYQQCTEYVQYLQATLPPNRFTTHIQQSRCNNNPNIHICCITNTAPVEEITTSSPLDERGLQILKSMELCGDASANRVAFGKEARLREFPWMALLEYATSSPNPYECGGSLITDRYVLTAAHCMVGVMDKIIAVILGEHNLDTDPDCQTWGKRLVCSPPRERYLVESLKPHPEYRKQQVGFDIALVKLDRVVEFQKHIRPICLPITPSTLVPQQKFTIAGWGTTENGQTSRELKKANVEYQERSVCEKVYRRQRITSHHLCVGGGAIDTCKGDSGGPLFIPTLYSPSKVRTVQYGIVSFGTKSCSSLEKFPGIYTNITEFMPWITSNIID